MRNVKSKQPLCTEPIVKYKETLIWDHLSTIVALKMSIEEDHMLTYLSDGILWGFFQVRKFSLYSVIWAMRKSLEYSRHKIN